MKDCYNPSKEGTGDRAESGWGGGVSEEGGPFDEIAESDASEENGARAAG